MSDELLPCPFCNGEASAVWDSSNPDRSLHRWEVACDDCDARSPQFETEEEATIAWNRRSASRSEWKPGVTDPVAWRWTAVTSRGVQLAWQYCAHKPTSLEDEDNFQIEPLYAAGPDEQNARLHDLSRLLVACGLGDHARPMSPAETFELCLREIAKLRGEVQP